MIIITKHPLLYSVIANMRGESAEEVATRLLASEELRGLQGPTISPVFTMNGDGAAAAEHGFYAAVICVPKKRLYPSVKELRKVCGSSHHGDGCCSCVLCSQRTVCERLSAC